MSLINEALKRASQFQQQEDDTVRINLKPSSEAALTPQPVRVSAPALKPEPSPELVPASKPQPPRSPVLPILVILLIATASLFIWLALFGRNVVSHAKRLAIRPPVPVVAAPKPAPPPATVQTVAVRAPVPAPWPPLNVQAIFYSGAKSQAIINRKTVYLGDTVGGGIRVAGISRNTVLFIAPDGSEKKLGLGE